LSDIVDDGLGQVDAAVEKIKKSIYAFSEFRNGATSCTILITSDVVEERGGIRSKGGSRQVFEAGDW
jgi:hypothetical protein